MSPRRQPASLYDMCMTKTFFVIARICYHISEKNQEKTNRINQDGVILKKYLLKMLPVRFFEILCLRRQTLEINIDPHLWLRIFTHPHMTYFKNCDLDIIVSERHWARLLPQLRSLRILHLQFICSDTLLKVIATNCTLLEELNVMSFTERKQGQISVSEEKISDVGLKYLTNLKQLRKLTLDPATSETFSNREISTEGIRTLLQHLPLLEKLQMPRHTCIASILYAACTDLGPLRLTALRSIDADFEVLKQVIQMCPHLRKLSVTYNFLFIDSEILDEIINCNVRLNKLILTEFPYSSSMARLLEVQSISLTELTLEQLPQELELDELEVIGLTCPHLKFFSLHIQISYFSLNFYTFRHSLPRQHTGPKIFQKLECLKLAGDNYDIQRITIFLISCTQNIKNLFIKYDRTIVCESKSFNYAINNGYLKNIERLVFDNLDVCTDLLKTIIKECEALKYLISTCDHSHMVYNFIGKNNYGLYFKNNKDEGINEFLKFKSRVDFVDSLMHIRPLPRRFKNYTAGYNHDFFEETHSSLLKRINRSSQSTKLQMP